MRLTSLLFCVLACPVFAQSELALRRYFEGRMVRARVDLPATRDGLDLAARADAPVDQVTNQSRLSEWGVGVPKGVETPITRVHVRKREIEFFFGTGGYGDVPAAQMETTIPRSAREEELAAQRKTEKDPRRWLALDREIDDLRRAREREQQRLELDKKRLEVLLRQEAREKAARAGSRITIHFEKDQLKAAVPAPEELMTMLRRCLDFSAGEAVARMSLTGLRRGMESRQVREQFGAPARFKEGKDGSVLLRSEAWDFEAETLEADFAEGIVLRWRVVSR